MRRAPTLPLLTVLLVLGVPRADEAEPPRKDAGAAEAVAASLDRSVAPCEDLYGFACGGWITGAEVPGWSDRWSRGTDALRQENFETLRGILEAAPLDPEKDPDHGRVGLFYSSCMAETIVEERGPGPLRPMMRRIAVARDGPGLAQVLAGMHRIGIDALWSARVLADAGDPPRYLLHLLPGGLGLPDPALYLADDAETVAVRESYVAHMAAMLAVLGEGAAGSSEKAAAVLALETRLAKAATGTGTPGGPAVDRAQLGELAPGFPWDTYFEALRAPEVDRVVLPAPDLLRAVEAILAEDDLASLRSYLRWQILRSTAPYLSSDLAEADFELFDRRIGGRKELEPRWQRCVAATLDALPESLGRLFVERRFSGEARERARQDVRALEAALRARVAGSGPEATARVAALTNLVGFPDAWRDESALKLSHDHFLENVLSARGLRLQRELERVGQPVGAADWPVSPASIQGGYAADRNTLILPAGLLQPPLFEAGGPAALRFGGIGTRAGRELGRGLVAAGGTCEAVAPTTLAELRGIDLAHAAWKSLAEEDGSPAVQGLTPEQLFFVAYAGSACTAGPPGPERSRVNGAVALHPAFAAAFGCPEEPRPCDPW